MLQIYNSLTRKKEEFQPLNPPWVGMYTCGPTVYDYASIGNFRTYVTSDILRRVLVFNRYKVKSVMNITDVGHLVGDGDAGQDKIAQTAEKERKTAWDIAKFYTEAFLKDMGEMGILPPDVMPRATEHIPEQIELIRRLEEKGFTYKTSDGIYFDIKKYETDLPAEASAQAGTVRKYGRLSTMEQIKPSARVEQNLEKKDPRDFALWKFSYRGGDAAKRRHMEWDSPWGLGFPGWHIECSAMSMKYLIDAFDPFGKLRVNGERSRTIDIHLGGEDLRQTHHPNEIAQSEGATGKPFVKYWVHATFLLVDGQRMGKSLGNVYRVSDIEEKGINPLALRYLYLTAHYKDPLNFTWEGLKAAHNAYERLQSTVYSLQQEKERSMLSPEKQARVDNYKKRFVETLNDDLNTPRALAVLWEVVKSNIPAVDKRDLLLSFDEVLGLGLGRVPPFDSAQGKRVPPFDSAQGKRVPRAVQELVKEREKLRKEGKWEEADRVRARVRELGYEIEDTEAGPKVRGVRKYRV